MLCKGKHHLMLLRVQFSVTLPITCTLFMKKQQVRHTGILTAHTYVFVIYVSNLCSSWDKITFSPYQWPLQVRSQIHQQWQKSCIVPFSHTATTVISTSANGPHRALLNFPLFLCTVGLKRMYLRAQHSSLPRKSAFAIVC